LYNHFETVNVNRNKFVEVFLRTNELMQMMMRLTQLEMIAQRGEEPFNKAREATINAIKEIHKNYSIAVDRGVFEAVIPLYKPRNVDASIYDKTAFKDLHKALKMLEGNSKAVIEKLNSDDAYQYAKPMVIEFYMSLEPEFQRVNTKINALETRYMKAMMEVMPEARYFPDANST
jgi:hypothetical protein